MEDIKIYFETSTIHGLSYISGTRKLWRLFWILTVFGGFATAGLLIYESFKSWAESPIATNIETLPITELKFPKVTVCPPKNTFTNLNYDIEMVGNRTLDNEVRYGLLKRHTNTKLAKLQIHFDFGLHYLYYICIKVFSCKTTSHKDQIEQIDQ